MSEPETQTSEYCTAPTTQNPSQPRPEAAEDDNILTAERGKPNSFGLFDDPPKNVTLSKFLPAATEINMMRFITGNYCLEQNNKWNKIIL